MIETVWPNPSAFTPLRVDDFLSYLKRRDRAPGTIKTYAWAVEDFHDFLRSQGVIGLHQVTRNHLEAWQDRLIAARLRPKSRSLATTGARQYLKWASDHDYCDPRLSGWLAGVHTLPCQPKPLPPADLVTLVQHYTPTPPPGDGQLLALRNRAMFFYFVTTGARVSEALQVTRMDFQRATVRQKGGTQKTMTVPRAVQPLIREYVAARVDDSPLLLVSQPEGRPLSPSGVRQVWQRVAAELGIPAFTTHTLRHTFATESLAQGIDIRVVAELMGHKNMQSIMGYTKVQEAARQRAEEMITAAIGFAVPEPEPDLPPDPRTTPSSGRGRPRFQLSGAQ